MKKLLIIFFLSSIFISCRKDSELENLDDYRNQFTGFFDFEIAHNVWTGQAGFSGSDTTNYSGLVYISTKDDLEDCDFCDSESDLDSSITILYKPDFKIVAEISQSGWLSYPAYYSPQSYFMGSDTIKLSHVFYSSMGSGGNGDNVIGIRY